MGRIIKIILTVTLVFGAFYFSGLLNGKPIDVSNEDDVVAKTFDYNFELKDLDGKTISADQLKGKVVFLNMWATWCGPCRKEMPSIQQLYDQLDHEKIAFVMLSLDTDENTGKVINYVKDKGFSFPVYQPSGALPKQLQVPSIPTTFVIGTDGKIKLKHVGTSDYNTEEFKSFMQNLTLGDAK